MSVVEAAHAAGVGHVKIREEIKAGRLVARRTGKLILIKAEDLAAWIDSLPSAAVAA